MANDCIVIMPGATQATVRTMLVNGAPAVLV